MKRIALLGPGTFTEEATRYLLGPEADKSVEFVRYKSIPDVFLATVNGQTDWSSIPIENTIEGSVSLHIDWFVHEVDLPIQTEWVYPITMNLIGYAEDLDLTDPTDLKRKFGRIKKVATYTPAFAQCRQFLSEYLPDVEVEVVGSTAEGARYVKGCAPGDGVAAIGNATSAQLNGLQLLAENIQNHDNNYTRFVLAGPEAVQRSLVKLQTSTSKTSVLITLPEDYPGALHQVLSAFAWRRINLSKIESRPTKKKLGNYYFYIDIDAPMDSVLLPSAIAEIEAIGCQVRILGTYPSYTFEPIA